MRRFKFMSLVLAIMMVVSSFTMAFSSTMLPLPNEKEQVKGILNVPKEKFDPIKIKESDPEEIISVIVELEDKPLLALSSAREQGAGKFLQTQSAQSLRSEMLTTQAVVKNNIMSNIGRDIEFTYEYTNTLNGFAAKVKRSDVEKLKNTYGVKAVYLDIRYDVPVEPKMNTSYEMIGDIAKLNVGLDGEGTVVAVIDTGVLVDHEIMKLDPGIQLGLTRKEVRELLPKLNAFKRMEEKGLSLNYEQVFKNNKFPFTFDYADVDDDATANRSDHGVHVAGTIGANGTAATADGTTISAISVFDGIARNAQILGMKVFSDENEGAYDSDIFAAIEDAITLNVDVINLSLGTTAGFTFYEGEDLVPYEYEYLLKNARDAGVFVAAASGNDGRVNGGTQLNMFATMSDQYFGGYGSNPFSVNPDTSFMGSPGLKKSATAVASADNIFAYINYMIFDEIEIPYLDATTVSFKETFEGREIDVVYVNEGVVNEKNKRDDYEQLDVKGKVVLIKRGGVNFATKVENAVTRGAIGCIIFNDDERYDSIISVGLDENTEYSIPVISLRTTDGAKLQEILAANNDKIFVKLGIGNKQISNMYVSDFSSWGASPDLGLNPEITAPGGNIYSASYSSKEPSNNAYASKSGTSMATPHVAGAAALMKEYIANNENDWFMDFEGANYVTVAESLLMSTAKTMINFDGFPFSPRQQGAGLMNIEAAISSPAYLLNKDTNKAKVELKEIGKEFSFTFDVYNISNKEVTYALEGSILSEESVVVVDSFGVPPKAFTTDRGFLFADSFMEFVEGNEITVEPKSSKQVTVNVKLSDAEVEDLLSRFENGFFVEGFVELKSVEPEEYPDLSIPYMGFYEDWTKAPIIDEPYPYELMTYKSFYGTAYILRDGNIIQEMCSGVFSSYAPYEYYEDNYLLGMYSYDVYLYGNYDFITFSPNGDGVLDDVYYRASLLRNAKEIDVNIKDSNGKIVRELSGDIYYPKTYSGLYYDGNWEIEYLINSWDLPAWDGKNEKGKVLPDGEYVYEISAYLDYDSEKAQEPQVKEIKVKLDTVAPKIEATYDETTDKVTVKLTDQFTIESYAIGEALADGTFANVTSKAGYIGNTVEYTFDVSMFEGDVAYFEVRDRAYNLNSIFIDITKTNTVVVEPEKPDTGSDDDPSDPGTPSDPTPVDPITPTPVDPVEPTIPEEDVPGGQVVPIEQFTDVKEDDWFYNDVKAVLEKGLMNGVGENQFAPLGNATRATIATVIHRMASLPEYDAEKVVAFSDVVADEWYEKAVNWASSTEIVKGYEDGRFKPSKNISREELAAMLYRYVATLGKGYEEGWTYELKFVDSEEVSDWSLEAISWMNENGIINGKDGNRLDPKGTATRAEIATMINRLSDFLSK